MQNIQLDLVLPARETKGFNKQVLWIAGILGSVSARSGSVTVGRVRLHMLRAGFSGHSRRECYIGARRKAKHIGLDFGYLPFLCHASKHVFPRQLFCRGVS